jgi:uncharacterized protein
MPCPRWKGGDRLHQYADSPQRQAMEQHLADVERDIGSQIVVLIVPTTLPEDIAAYAQRVGDQWKIGRRDVGDGLLIVVAKNDRKVRIEVAKALEGAVPDLAARQIITETISPAFKGRLCGRLNAGIDRLPRASDLKAAHARHAPRVGRRSDSTASWRCSSLSAFRSSARC